MAESIIPILERLLWTNSQWAELVEAAESGFFAESAEGQSPKVLWIGCADSRVPESLITGSKPGDIFVHRNIANQFHLDDDSAQSVVHYAVKNLGVKHIVVVGHTQCGGVAASLTASATPSTTDSHKTPLGRWLAPLIDLARALNVSAMPTAEALSQLMEENVKLQVSNLAQSETLSEGKEGVSIHGWVYDIAQGRLRDLNISRTMTTKE